MNRVDAVQFLGILKWHRPDVETPDGMVDFWAGMLSDIPGPAVLAAVAEWVRGEYRWPTPIDIRTLVANQTLGIPEPDAAWAQVVACLKLDPIARPRAYHALPQMIRAAVATIGGVGAINGATDLTFFRRDFLSVYGRLRKVEIQSADLSLASGERPAALGDGQ